MKFFLDTAHIQEIKAVAEMGLLDGVTTNPSLMAKIGVRNFDAHYMEICNIVQGDVSAEVIATDFEQMLQEGRNLAGLHENIVVKIPMIPAGIRAIQALANEGIRTNCTLIFTAAQALLAAKAGATYVSPFIGRLDDISVNGMQLIEDIRVIFDNYEYETQILAASLRSTTHLIECARAGANVATMPYNVFNALFHHPLTEIGLARFLSDHKAAMQALSK